MMTVEQIMVKEVLTIEGTSLLGDVWKLLSKKKINSAPVVDKDNHLIGILSKEDMLKLLYPDYKAYIVDIGMETETLADDKEFGQIMKKKVMDVMNRNVIHTHKQTSATRALARMIAHRVNQLPVVDDESHVVGLLTKGAVFQGLYRFHKTFFNRRSK